MNMNNHPAIELLSKKITFDKIYFPVFDRKFLNEVDVTRLEDKEYLAGILLEFYSKNNYKELQRIIANWENYDHVKKRKDIFKTIINILKSKLSDKDKANSAIPLLLANLDGTIKDMYVELNLTKTPNFAKHQNMLKQMLENLLYSHFFLGGNFLKIMHQLFCFEKGLSLHEDIEMLNFSKTDYEKDYKNILNRNSILHGEFLDYGSKLELIRLVILLDLSVITIQDLLDQRN